MALPPRLARPAKFLFDAMNMLNVEGILVGGAAIRLNGGPGDTTDLDIDVSSFSFTDHLPQNSFRVRAKDPLNTSRLRVTYLGELDPVRCDLAMRRTYTFHKYSRKTPDGICYALPNLLLAHKICSVTERPIQVIWKIDTDLTDIKFLIRVMMNENKKMPSDISAAFLTDKVRVAFKDALLDDEREEYLELLSYVGIHIPDVPAEQNRALMYV